MQSTTIGTPAGASATARASSIGASIVAQALQQGLLLNSPQPDALRFMPALNVTRAEISEMIEGLDAILTEAGVARRVA